MGNRHTDIQSIAEDIRVKFEQGRIAKQELAVFKKYKPVQINPKTRTPLEARKMWYSFPGYKEKIEKFGILVWRLK